MKLITGRLLTQREREIEAEFREPFGSVVRGFAQMGWSKSDTARWLGYSKQDFVRRVLPRHDPVGEIEWPAKGEGRSQLEQDKIKQGG